MPTYRFLRWLTGGGFRADIDINTDNILTDDEVAAIDGPTGYVPEANDRFATTEYTKDKIDALDWQESITYEVNYVHDEAPDGQAFTGLCNITDGGGGLLNCLAPLHGFGSGVYQVTFTSVTYGVISRVITVVDTNNFTIVEPFLGNENNVPYAYDYPPQNGEKCLNYNTSPTPGAPLLHTVVAGVWNAGVAVNSGERFIFRISGNDNSGDSGTYTADDDIREYEGIARFTVSTSINYLRDRAPVGQAFTGLCDITNGGGGNLNCFVAAGHGFGTGIYQVTLTSVTYGVISRAITVVDANNFTVVEPFLGNENNVPYAYDYPPQNGETCLNTNVAANTIPLLHTVVAGVWNAGVAINDGDLFVFDTNGNDNSGDSGTYTADNTVRRYLGGLSYSFDITALSATTVVNYINTAAPTGKSYSGTCNITNGGGGTLNCNAPLHGFGTGTYQVTFTSTVYGTIARTITVVDGNNFTIVEPYVSDENNVPYVYDYPPQTNETCLNTNSASGALPLLHTFSGGAWSIGTALTIGDLFYFSVNGNDNSGDSGTYTADNSVRRYDSDRQYVFRIFSTDTATVYYLEETSVYYEFDGSAHREFMRKSAILKFIFRGDAAGLGQSQVDIDLFDDAGILDTGVLIPWAYYIVAATLQSNSPRTAGTLTLEPTINGVKVTPSDLDLVLNGVTTNDAKNTVAANTSGFSGAANTKLNAKYTTDAAWATASGTESIFYTLHIIEQ